ncbi:unnamed protein product [Arabis nemorensis]|uniref:Uncharacterized protein n=1 Tax=Arabis nemorensis TaxID=586526 RepID=A0A565BQT5_9BRAS|nr:unnamed protein product [Arabis nemorensis]
MGQGLFLLVRLVYSLTIRWQVGLPPPSPHFDDAAMELFAQCFPINLSGNADHKGPAGLNVNDHADSSLNVVHADEEKEPAGNVVENNDEEKELAGNVVENNPLDVDNEGNVAEIDTGFLDEFLLPNDMFGDDFEDDEADIAFSFIPELATVGEDVTDDDDSEEEDNGPGEEVGEDDAEEEDEDEMVLEAAAGPGRLLESIETQPSSSSEDEDMEEEDTDEDFEKKPCSGFQQKKRVDSKLVKTSSGVIVTSFAQESEVQKDSSSIWEMNISDITISRRTKLPSSEEGDGDY